MSHTPGPWSIQRHDKGDSRRLLVVGKSGMVADVDWNDKDENEANARLIAAAPDLLAALKSMLKRAVALDQSATVDGLANCDAIAKARAAIAKAEAK